MRSHKMDGTNVDYVLEYFSRISEPYICIFMYIFPATKVETGDFLKNISFSDYYSHSYGLSKNIFPRTIESMKKKTGRFRNIFIIIYILCGFV